MVDGTKLIADPVALGYAVDSIMVAANYLDESAAIERLTKLFAELSGSDELAPDYSRDCTGSMRRVFPFGEHHVIKLPRSPLQKYNEREVQAYDRLWDREYFAEAKLITIQGVQCVLMEAVIPYEVHEAQCEYCSGYGEIDHECDCPHCNKQMEECEECGGTGRGDGDFYAYINGERINLNEQVHELRKITTDWPQGGISKISGDWKWYDYQPW